MPMLELSLQDMKIRDFIKSLLDDHQMTQDELAQILGCSRSNVSLLLSGKRKWTEKYIDALFAGLGVDMRKKWESDLNYHNMLSRVLKRQDKDADFVRELLERCNEDKSTS